ncbi:hypothetical protein NC652_002543 [Populus alba x Populus x berolinensis]|nr:hypothetical protein NC652_002543 [Populus alba x Populus x berolinensis]
MASLAVSNMEREDEAGLGDPDAARLLHVGEKKDSIAAGYKSGNHSRYTMAGRFHFLLCIDFDQKIIDKYLETEVMYVHS